MLPPFAERPAPRRGPHCRSSNPGVRCDVARHIVFPAGRPVRGRARRPAGPHPPSERPTSPIGGCRSHVLRYDRGSLRRRGPACARRGRTACFLRREFLRSDGCRSAGLVSRRRRFLGGAARGRGPRIPAAADASLLSLSGQVTRATTPGSTRPSLKRIRRPLGRPPPRGSASRLRVSADRPPENVWVRGGVTGSPGGPPGCSPNPRRPPREDYQSAQPPPRPRERGEHSREDRRALQRGRADRALPSGLSGTRHRRGRFACLGGRPRRPPRLYHPRLQSRRLNGAQFPQLPAAAGFGRTWVHMLVVRRPVLSLGRVHLRRIDTRSCES